MRALRVGHFGAFLTLMAQGAAAQDACPTPTLPAYAHNDYANARPLRNALELGYRGVEADVFLVAESLRVGHDRKAASRGPTLAAAYLSPLVAIAERCAAAGSPLLLFIEMKDETEPTRRELVRLLEAHASMRSRVDVVLVGRAPGATVGESSGLAGVEFALTHSADRPPPNSAPRLISIDYGKTMGRWWVRRSGRDRWLAAIRVLRRQYPTALIRVHNVPVDGGVYRTLLAAGVDLIGTKNLSATRDVLPRTRF